MRRIGPQKVGPIAVDIVPAWRTVGCFICRVQRENRDRMAHKGDGPAVVLKTQFHINSGLLVAIFSSGRRSAMLPEPPDEKEPAYSAVQTEPRRNHAIVKAFNFSRLESRLIGFS